MSNLKEYVIRCDCQHPEHTVVLSYLPNESPHFNFLYLQPFLSTGGFARRLKEGLRYILDRKSKYGQFGEILLTSETAGEVVDFIAGWLEIDCGDGPRMRAVRLLEEIREEMEG